METNQSPRVTSTFKLKPRYVVHDETGWCGGFSRKRTALAYARDRSTLGHSTTVLRVVAAFKS